MDLSDLAIFRAVVDAGGVTKAAARLNRVQSNISARMRKLEDDLGVELFSRQGRGLKLAPAGTLLLSYAGRMLDLAEEAREAVRGGALSGTFRLGAMESTAAARLPAPLAEFHRRHPQITLELSTGSTRKLVANVVQGEIDAALVAGPVDDPRLETRGIYVEKLIVVTPARTTAAIAKPLTLLTFESGCSYRKMLEDWVTRRGGTPDRIVEMTSYHAILGCVAAGMGIALVPACLIAIYPGQSCLSLIPVEPDLATMNTVLVWRKTAPAARIEALAGVLSLAADPNPAA